MTAGTIDILNPSELLEFLPLPSFQPYDILNIPHFYAFLQAEIWRYHD